jgi:hypothetical protein
VALPRRSSSAGSLPRKRSARRRLEVRAGSPVLWERRGAKPRDEEAAVAVQLDDGANGRRLALVRDELVARRLRDEEDVRLGLLLVVPRFRLDVLLALLGRHAARS